MEKHFVVFAKWRSKDVTFLKTLDLEREPEEGYFGFGVVQGSEAYNKIKEHYLNRTSLFGNVQPPEFVMEYKATFFDKKELLNAAFYNIGFADAGSDFRFPEPSNNYPENLYDFDCLGKYCSQGRVQKLPIRVKIPKRKKGVFFSVNARDIVFFRKEFYLEYLAPRGLGSMEVIDHKTGKASEEYV